MEIHDYFIDNVEPEEYTKICNQKGLLSKKLKKFNLDGRSFSFKYVQENKLVGVFVKRENSGNFLIIRPRNLRNDLERKFVEEMMVWYKEQLNQIRNNS